MASEIIKSVMDTNLVLSEDYYVSYMGLGSTVPCYSVWAERMGNINKIIIKKTNNFEKNKLNIGKAVKKIELQVTEYKNRGQMLKKLAEACR